MSEYGYGDMAGAVQSVPNGATSLLGENMAAFRLATAGAGMGSQYIDAANNSVTTVSQDTYTASELGVDNGEVTVKAAGNKDHLRNN